VGQIGFQSIQVFSDRQVNDFVIDCIVAVNNAVAQVNRKLQVLRLVNSSEQAAMNSCADTIAARASNRSLGALSVIDKGAALVHGPQKVRITNVLGVYQINPATEQFFQRLRQFNPAPGARAGCLFVELNQKIEVARFRVEIRPGRRSK
jgi:hypothetical protein